MAEFKTCKYTAEAIVSDGIDKGELRKVCTEPNCPVHHPKKQTPKADASFKAEQEKRRREEALANATGIRVLQSIVAAVPVRLMKRDLVFISEQMLPLLDEKRLEMVARNRGIKAKEGESAMKLLIALIRKSDEGNVEEFGSVYEGLLEYDPVFLNLGNVVEFGLAEGDERARTGSDYTPDDLVQPLIKHSLDYLIAERLKAPNPESALLDLRITDIACGSGHILLAAARRIANELAVVRTGEEQPSPTAFRAAVRDVIRTCIYGVDLNLLAVELCKVALWLEAHNPGQPLNFLDHHIKCGNAIVGFARQEELDKGVPDEAFATMPGDDKEIVALWRKTNKQDRKDTRQMRLAPAVQQRLEGRLTRWNELSELPEHTPAEIESKKQRFRAFTESADASLFTQIAAIPIAQFYISKTVENSSRLVTDSEFRRYWVDGLTPQSEGTGIALAMSIERRFFHWFLEFPDIIARGGFDCILGNPPYLGGSFHPLDRERKWSIR